MNVLWPTNVQQVDDRRQLGPWVHTILSVDHNDTQYENNFDSQQHSLIQLQHPLLFCAFYALENTAHVNRLLDTTIKENKIISTKVTKICVHPSSISSTNYSYCHRHQYLKYICQTCQHEYRNKLKRVGLLKSSLMYTLVIYTWWNMYLCVFRSLIHGYKKISIFYFVFFLARLYFSRILMKFSTSMCFGPTTNVVENNSNRITFSSTSLTIPH